MKKKKSNSTKKKASKEQKFDFHTPPVDQNNLQMAQKICEVMINVV